MVVKWTGCEAGV